MIKTIPDLNKIKFIKIHRKKRIRNVNKGNKGKKLSCYSLALISNKATIITTNQLEALKKSLNRSLKTKEKKNKKNFKIIKSIKATIKKKKKKNFSFFLRYNFVLGLTKKPLQVRMGKGKGNPVEWVYPTAKNRILLEFNLKTSNKLKKIKRFLVKGGRKLKVKTTILIKKKKKKVNKQFDLLSFNNKINKTVCVREL